MGLDTTHGAFSGAYSAFNRFRQIVAKAMGGSYPPHARPLVCADGDIIQNPDDSRFYVACKWEKFQEKQPGLSAFLSSNDCEGEFSPEVCRQMADEIEALLPKIEELDECPSGHIERDGGYVEVAKRYIAGCRLAADKNETLEYL